MTILIFIALIFPIIPSYPLISLPFRYKQPRKLYLPRSSKHLHYVFEPILLLEHGRLEYLSGERRRVTLDKDLLGEGQDVFGDIVVEREEVVAPGAGDLRDEIEGGVSVEAVREDFEDQVLVEDSAELEKLKGRVHFKS